MVINVNNTNALLNVFNVIVAIMVTEMVGCRLTPEFIKKIDSLVENGDFTSRGEFVKYAIRQTLKRYEGRSPPLGMIEGLHRRERNSQDSRRRR